MKIQQLKKQLKISALAFAYAATSIAPAMADDSEIYIGGATGGAAGGAPNVLMLLDTSGSMLFTMYEKYPTGHPLADQLVPTKGSCSSGGTTWSDNDCAVNEDDKRVRHLVNAVRRILENMDGNIRVGLSRYNKNNGDGGRIIYPVRRLNDPVNANAIQDRTYLLGSSSMDADQVSSDGTKIRLSGSTLVLGNPPAVSGNVTKSPSSNHMVRVSNDAKVTLNQSGAVFTLGGYAKGTGNNDGRTSAIGVKYRELGIPNGAQIVSAQLLLTPTTSAISNGSDFDGPKTTDSAAFAFTLSVEDDNFPKDYADSGNWRVTGSKRNYSPSGSMTINVAAGELLGSDMLIDVKSIIQNKVNSPSWDKDSEVAIKLAGVENYTVPNKKGRRILEPKLILSYTSEPGVTYTGVQFSGMDIPQGATINSAKLVFTANSPSSGTANFEIKTDPAVTPAEFSSTEHLDAARWNGGFVTTWSPGNWVADSEYSADVKSILQQHVNRSDFCGGLGVAFRIRETTPYNPATNTTTQRFAYSYDGNASKSPKLVVNYTLPTPSASTCLLASRTVSVRGSTDDGESVSGTQTLAALTARIRSNTDVGLRFANLTVPQGAVIRKVILKLKAANSPSSSSTRGSFTVKGAKLANVDTFSTTNTIASMLSVATSASETITPSSWSANTAYEYAYSNTGGTKATTGLLGVVQEIVDQSSWVSGNGLALLLKGSINSTDTCNNNKYPCIYQADQGSASAAKLTIYYESSNPQDGIKTVRQDLIELVESLPDNLNSYTPLGETYYESALYMRGDSAFYGRGYGSSLSSPARYVYADSQAAMNTSNVYQSPIDGGSCQSNNIIALTDGAPTGDDDNKSTGGSCSGAFDCMKKTAANLKTTGFTHGSPAQTSTISTYTIGFGPEVTDTSTAAYKGLADTAIAGGGEFFPATDVDSLVASFETIFSRLADTNGTMASPGVAVNQMNRTQHLDQLYYGVFKPQTTKRWPGNLKRYRLGFNAAGDPIVVDADGRAAISTATKYFDTNAKSWWWSGPANETDGNEASKGGAAAKQTSELKVYTNDASNAMSALDSANPPAGMGVNDVKWIQGYDVDNANGQGSSGFRQSMGSPMHAQPTMLAKNQTDYTVYIGTNDGLLHAINNQTGEPIWAWLPKELQSKVSALRANGALGSGGLPIYGLDGTWTMTEVLGQVNKRLLIGGMRQGGNYYYALKVDKDPTISPQVQWQISPTTSTAFARLGNTWSQPQSTFVRVGGVITPVIVFGGGLDYTKYEAGANAQAGTGTDFGNAVYMVNANTGALVWWASANASSSSTATYVANLKYSVPGSVKVIDKNGDGFADHLYFGDLGGQIFRVDIDNRTTTPKLVKRVTTLARLGNAEAAGKANDRRFYEMPAVEYAIDSAHRLYAAVAIGSGDRSFPKSNTTTEERFYVIRDYDAARFDILENSNGTAAYMDEAGRGYNGTLDLATRTDAIKTTDLANLTATYGTSATTAANNAKGWWIKMPSVGEKVLSTPFIFSRRMTDGSFQYQVNFNSFAPGSASASGCSPVAGSTSSWSVLLANAGAASNPNSVTASDRYTEGVAAGITGSGVPMVVDRDGDGQGDTLVELTGTGAQTRGAVPLGLGKIQRTRWYDKRSN